jgi:hypothetical protein
MRTSDAWYTSVAPGSWRWFRGRHFRQVAITDGRVHVTTRRRGDTVLDVAVADLEVTRVRRGILYQVLATDRSSRVHIFEFRLRRHHAGRAFVDALRLT